MLRRDLVELCAGARDAGLYSSLITAGTLFTRERAQALKAAGLDHVQISIQSPDAAGERSHRRQPVVREEARGRAPREGARLPADDQLRPAPPEPRSRSRRCSSSRSSSARSGSSWPTRSTTAGRSPTSEALMPTREQLRRAEAAVQRFRERVGPKVDVLWVLPDFYEELPKPCMGGWGRTAMVVAPNGDVLPCQAASTIPGLEFANVRDHSLRVDLERVRRVRALPRDRLDAGAMPHVPARAPGGGLGRLPLPGAAARRRRGGDRSGLPVLAPSRRRRRRARRARRRTSSSTARSSGRRGSRSPAPAGRPARCAATRAPRRGHRCP